MLHDGLLNSNDLLPPHFKLSFISALLVAVYHNAFKPLDMKPLYFRQVPLENERHKPREGTIQRKSKSGYYLLIDQGRKCIVSKTCPMRSRFSLEICYGPACVLVKFSRRKLPEKYAKVHISNVISVTTAHYRPQAA